MPYFKPSTEWDSYWNDNPFELNVSASDPYINGYGKLVIKITVCDESFEREITGQKDDDGGWILKEV